MPLTANSFFIASGGELRNRFLPSTEALEASLVPEWLTSAQGIADNSVDLDEDDIELWVTARVYELAYRAIVSHQSIEPTQESTGSASVQRNKEGKDYFKQRLDFWAGVRQSYLPLLEDGLQLPEPEPVAGRAGGIVIGSSRTGSMTDAMGDW